MSQQAVVTGAENVHWDLTDLYTDIDDPAVVQDLDKLVALVSHADALMGGPCTPGSASVSVCLFPG